MSTSDKARKTNKRRPQLAEDIGNLQHDLWKLSRKISGLGSLYLKASTDESGVLDIDNQLIGIGETLQDYASDLARLASIASEAEIFYSQKLKSP
jgi:hypothetical protein